MDLHASRHFASWLAEQQLSLGLSTYEAGKIVLVGRRSDGQLAANERSFSRAMGLWSDGQTLWAATSYQIWRFANVLGEGELDNDADRLFVPRVGYTTGDVDAHDLVFAEDRLQFVSTLFCCLAGLSDRHNFTPLWQPSFLSRLVAEDRCHLNGVAVRDGRPRYFTAVSRSDVAEGWRDYRRDGGVVIDRDSGEILCSGLSMPHSPRWHQDRLWLLDSGNGRFGHLDADGRFVEVAFCPGYARGLAFHGDYAVVGLSRPRERTFAGLALDEQLQRRGARPRTGVAVIDLRRGELVHSLYLDERISELYDVITLPGVRRPKMLGFRTKEIQHTLSIEGEAGLWRSA
ncbi:MAG: TIGR03032 family protein [Xanthomonadales bacterium]|nr:TIGR03032 family protein [Xanthomonadales bacterium]